MIRRGVGKAIWPASLYSNSMNYDNEILFILNEAGENGLSVKKIAMHVFNSCNDLFDVVSFDEVHRYVSGYLARNSRCAGSRVLRTDVRGVYRINSSFMTRQLTLDFKEDEHDLDCGQSCTEDKSLLLF